MPTTIAITGATDGLGRALATELATEDTQLILHGRNPGKLDQLLAELGPSATRTPQTLVADFSDLAQVSRAADTLVENHDALHVLINNAGIGGGAPDGRERRVSRDGHELRFAVNYLAAFVLAEKLLPLLRASAATDAAARVVQVASLSQHPLDFDDLMLESHYGRTRAYSQSKLAQVMHAFDLAERLPPHEVLVNSLHPGTHMPTKIVLSEISSSLDSLATGVRTTRTLATARDLEGTTGQFFDRLTPAMANLQSYDRAARAALRRHTLELVEGHYTEPDAGPRW